MAAVTKPSEKRMISAIVAKSGTIIAIGRNKAFKLSGSSTLPAYLEESNQHVNRVTGYEIPVLFSVKAVTFYSWFENF